MTSIISIIPISTLLIMGIAIAVSFINMTINRLLVTRLVGWEQYRSMQREISEYRSQTMAAMRSKDQKLLEKLKRKESQINSMQMKISKPQLYLFPISMSYIVIWFFFLTPTYAAVSTVAYLPGIGSISYVIWYFICSLMFGTLASRVIGVNPLQ